MNEEKSFLDSRTIIAILLVAVIWMGWQSYMTKKYPPAPATATETKTDVANTESTTPLAPEQKAVEQKSIVPSSGVAPKLPLKETITTYDSEVWSFEVSSKGMAIKNVVLKRYKERSGENIRLANESAEGSFATKLVGKNIVPDFNITIDGNTIKGTAQVGALKIEKTYVVVSSKYTLETTQTFTGLESGVQGASIDFSEIVKKAESPGFMMPANEYHSFFVAQGSKEKSEHLAPDKDGSFVDPQENVSVASIGSVYFTKAVLDQSQIQPKFTGNYEAHDGVKLAKGSLSYSFPAGVDNISLQQKTFIGPKDYDLLNSIDSQMIGIMNYSMLGFIAKPMLKTLKFLHGIFSNWGIAIIFLTILVRILVLPFYMASMRSTKAMKKIQPEMASIKAKYKDNPQQLNQEVMRLFKENKVNPIGGCLPMLLQLPIFFALYRVLSQSIELYQSPFFFWIHDLSLKDPFYVLPVLMGIAMFWQQRIMPAAGMDPAQQKVLMFMPVLFAGMMLGLPSGLTLYILVSTIFGIAQQYIFMRETASTPVTAKA